MADNMAVRNEGLLIDASNWEAVGPRYDQLGRQFSGVAPYDAFFGPVAAAIRGQWYANAWNELYRNPVTPDPTFDWGQKTHDTLKAEPKLRGYEQFFAGSVSEADFDQRLQMAREKLRDNEILADSGWGAGAQLLVGALDPIQFLGASRFLKASSLMDAVKASPGIVIRQNLITSGTQMATDPFAERSDAAAALALSVLGGPVLAAGVYVDRGKVFTMQYRVKEMMNTLFPTHFSGPDLDLTLRARGFDPTIPDPRPAGSASAGAAASGYQQPTGSASTGIGIEKLPTSPLVRGINSESAAESNITKQLFAAPFADQSNRSGMANPTSAEVASWRWQSRVVDAINAADAAYSAHRTGNAQAGAPGFLGLLKLQVMDAISGTQTSQLTHRQFKSRVWEQAITGKMDDPVAEVNQAAKAYRKFFDDMSAERKALGFVEMDVDALRFQMRDMTIEELFVSRIWNEMSIREQPDLWNQKWTQYQAMLPADHPHMKLTAKQAADYITLDRPFVSSDDNITGKSKSMHERTFKVPSILFREFLNTDIEAIARFYARTMGVDIEIGRRFRTAADMPDVRMRSAFDELRMEAARRIDDMLNPSDPYAAGQKPGTKILNDWQAGIDAAAARARKEVENLRAAREERAEPGERVVPIEDLNRVRAKYDAEAAAETKMFRQKLADLDPKAAAIFDGMQKSMENVQNLRDLLRGTYGQVADPFSLTSRTVRAAKQVTAMTLLSGVATATLDIGNVVLREGLSNTFAPAFIALRDGLDKLKLSGSAVKEAGQALDMVLNSRAAAISDLSDIHGRYSMFERALDNMSSVAFVFNGMSPWTAMMKQYAGVVIQSGLERRINLALAGKLPTAELADLRRMGLTDNLMRSFADQMATHGERIDSVFLPNHHLWTNDALRMRWTEIIAENANRLVVTPSKGEIPLWMSHPAGQIIGQFKSFGVGTMNRVMIPALQEKDQRLLVGVAMLVGMGYAVDQLRHAQGNDHRQRSLREQIGRAVERSGVLGYFTDIGRAFDNLSDGRFGYGALIGSPHFGSGMLSSITDLAGPAVQQGARVIDVGADLFSGDPDRYTARNIRKLIPLNNTAHLDWSFDAVEKGLAAGFR